MDDIERLLARHWQEKAAGRDRNVPTSDEQFQKLGYVRRHVPECVERSTARIYERGEGRFRVTIEILQNGFCEARENNAPSGFTKDEIRACNQALNEMEVFKNAEIDG